MLVSGFVGTFLHPIMYTLHLFFSAVMKLLLVLLSFAKL